MQHCCKNNEFYLCNNVGLPFSPKKIPVEIKLTGISNINS